MSHKSIKTIVLKIEYLSTSSYSITFSFYHKDNPKIPPYFFAAFLNMKKKWNLALKNNK